MTSKLTTVSEVTKKGAVVFAVTVVLFIVGKFTFDIAIVACCRKATPTPTPYINLEFGKLSNLTFSRQVPTTKDIKINLETLDGNVPNIGTFSGVIFDVERKSAPKAPTIDYEERSRNLAQALNYTNITPIQDGDSGFIFESKDDPGKRLKLDYIFYNYSISYDNPINYISFDAGSAPTIEEAKRSTLQLLSTGRRDLAEVAQTPTLMSGTYSYVNPTTQEISLVGVQNEANVTKINVQRNPIVNTPFISESTTEANIYATFTGLTAGQITGNTQTRLLEARVTLWPINMAQLAAPATYPLRSPQRAWENILAGNGYILNKVIDGDEYNVRRIYLAYYEPLQKPEYIQPVWVFEGDKVNDSNFLFRSIVPAVAEGYAGE